MDATEAAMKLLLALNDQSIPLLDEKELQRRLDYVYDDITCNIATLDSLQKKVQSLQRSKEGSDYSYSVYEDVCDTITKLHTTKQKFTTDYHLSNILWELYRLMIRGEMATNSSKDAYASKQRKAKRPNDPLTNNTIILKEIELADELLETVSALKRSYFVEEPKHDDLMEKLSNIDGSLEMARRSLDSIVELEVKFANLESKIDHLQKTMEDEFEKVKKARHDETETLINAQINAMMQILKAFKEREEPPPSSRLTSDNKYTMDLGEVLGRIERKLDELPGRRLRPVSDTSERDTADSVDEEILEEPREIAETRKRLKSLEDVPVRIVKRPRTLIVRKEDTMLSCSFCKSTGQHEPDQCGVFPKVAERMRIVNEAALCKSCLRLCPSPCPNSTKCDYCGSRNHHKALCTLPEEKLDCLQELRTWDFQASRQCAGAPRSADKKHYRAPIVTATGSWRE